MKYGVYTPSFSNDLGVIMQDIQHQSAITSHQSVVKSFLVMLLQDSIFSCITKNEIQIREKRQVSAVLSPELTTLS